MCIASENAAPTDVFSSKSAGTAAEGARNFTQPRRELRLAPEPRPCLFQHAAEPHRADPPRESGRVIGFDRDRAERGRPIGRLELALRDATDEAAERFF